MLNQKSETFTRTLEYQKQLLLQTQLIIKHQQLLEKHKWYNNLIGLLSKAHTETLLVDVSSVTNDSEVEALLAQYQQAIYQLQTDFLIDVRLSHTAFLKKSVTRHVVDNRAILIRDEQIKTKMLTDHMHASKEWINAEVKKLVIDKSIFLANTQYQNLVKRKKANEKICIDIANQLAEVTEEVHELDKSLISSTKDLWKDVVEYYQLKDLENYLSDTTERELQAIDYKPIDAKSAKQVLKIKTDPRSIEELKNRVCKFLSHLNQKEEYIKQYTENKFFRLMIEIIEDYTKQEHTRLDSNSYLNRVKSFLTVNEKVKKERNGEVELVIAILDLAVRDQLSQQDINSTFNNLAANAKRGIFGTSSLVMGGKSSFHDKIQKLINLLHTNEAITRFGESFDLQAQKLNGLQTELDDMKKKQEAQDKQIATLMQMVLAQQAQAGNPINTQGLMQQGFFQSPSDSPVKIAPVTSTNNGSPSQDKVMQVIELGETVETKEFKLAHNA